MLGRRFLLIVALLMGLTALAATVAPQQPRPRDARSTPAPATATPGAEPSDSTLEHTISAEMDGQRVVVDEGDLVELTVTGTSLDTVSVEGVGIETVDAESDAVFHLLAEPPGQYAIELLESEQRIGTLVVR
jgi:hypothetical protein